MRGIVVFMGYTVGRLNQLREAITTTVVERCGIRKEDVEVTCVLAPGGGWVATVKNIADRSGRWNEWSVKGVTEYTATRWLYLSLSDYR